MTRLTGAALARFHAGDPTFFRELVDAYSPRLLAVALSYAKDTDDAHDLVQEAWYRAFEKRASYSGSGSILGWLYAICRNIARARARRSGSGPGFPGATVATPHDETEQAELRRRLHDAISELPTRERDVVVLRLIEGRSTRDTAAIMACAEGTVKAALHHAVKKLQSALEVWTR